MFDRLRGLWSAGATQRSALGEALSVAVLLLELARADFEFAAVEREAIRKLLMQRYRLDAAQAQALLVEAKTQSETAISLYDYVAALNARLAPAQKYELLRMLWQVACADGRIEPHEEALLRKLAGLLYVPEADYVRAKLEVLEGRPSL
jgi:uncharacterized tellurite resistance protein B-like protein